MSKIYYGWYMVAIAIVAQMLLYGLVFACFGLFVIPVSGDFGLSRAEMNSALVLLTIGAGLTAPLVGTLLDKLPLRLVLAASTAFLCGCLALLALSRSMWLSAFIMLLPLPFAVQAAGVLSMNVLLVRWFKLFRSRAIALGMLGLSLGGIMVPPLVAASIEGQGWRQTLLLSSAILFVILVPLFLFVRDRPGPADVEAAGADRIADVQPVSQTGQSDIRTILAAPAFWIIAIAAGLATAVMQGTQVSLVPMAIGTGLSTIESAALLSAFGGGVLAGMFLAAYIGDRIDRITLLCGLYILLATMNAALLVTQSHGGLIAISAGLGLAGAATPVYQALAADIFGANSFGKVRGLLTPIVALLTAVSVRFGGEIYDRTGGYEIMLYTFVALPVVSAVLIRAIHLPSVRSSAPLEKTQATAKEAAAANGSSLSDLQTDPSVATRPSTG